MMKVRLKDIKEFNAIDLTHAERDELLRVHQGRQIIAFSFGVNGCNGVVVENLYDGKLYKVVGRCSALLMLL